MNSIMTYVYTLVIFSIFLVILEMIIPKGNSKKYIKLVGGLVLVYIVISPIVNTFLNIEDVEANVQTVFNDLSTSNKIKEINKNKYIMNIFEEGVKIDIENILEKEGYLMKNFEMKYNVNEKNEIQDITYISFNMYDSEKSNKVRKVYISINDKVMYIPDDEKKIIKQKIADTYNINMENVHII